MIHLLLSQAARALGPAHIVVLYNPESADAESVALAYAEARQLPVGHLCATAPMDPTTREVDFATFETDIRAPFEACRDGLPQPDEIDAIVTVRGLPYVVTLPNFVVGVEALLQVGRGLTGGTEIAGMGQISPSGAAQASVLNPEFAGQGQYCDAADLQVTNPYGSWYRTTCALQEADKLPRAFARDRRHEYVTVDLTGELYVVTRLDGFDFADASALVERGLAADEAYPDATFLCMAGGDEARAARDPECELTTRRLAEAGIDATWLGTHDAALAGPTVVGYFTGAASLQGAIDGLDYAPGAIACNLTSYGAVPQNFFCDATGALCPEAESQTSVARFIRAGATGAHGTVAEPLNNSFPGAGAMVLYAAGYGLGESFLLAQEFLYWQNLVLGDPLATPFAERPDVVVDLVATEGGAVHVTATHPDGVAEVRLYWDGVRVADAEGDTLDWEHGAAQGSVLDLFAVAIAADRELERTGWPIATQTARAETQGWTSVAVDVVADAPATGDDAEGDKGGCGCAQRPGDRSPVPLLGLLLVVSRRRGSSARSGSDRR